MRVSSSPHSCVGANEILSINDKGARAWFFPHKWIGLPIGFTDAVCADIRAAHVEQLASTMGPPKIMLAPRDRIVRMMATNEANSPCTAEGRCVE